MEKIKTTLHHTVNWAMGLAVLVSLFIAMATVAAIAVGGFPSFIRIIMGI